MINNENIRILEQYIESLEESLGHLEKAVRLKDLEKTKKLKQFILEIQSKIGVLLR